MTEKAKQDTDRERIIKYLKVRWHSYYQDVYLGISRHTFALPEDWEQALRKE